ncbi:MAG TPA: GNAT family N-acetyltransferase [Phnomibacter sp.]|nr:GNAT family N-acetyltransferase [Phnomibacter sp.]
MEIRQANTGDIPTILHIASLTWPHAYGDILQPRQISYMLEMMYSPDVLLQQMEQEGHRFLLAYSAGKPIGFAGFSPYENESWKLHKLYVLPFQQQTGVGKKLLQQAEQQAQQSGAKAMYLNVNRHNKAKDFYSYLGYSIHAEGDFEIGAGFFMNDYIMKKTFL